MKDEDIVYKYTLCMACELPHCAPKKITVKQAKEG